jgi:ribonuclease HI
MNIKLYTDGSCSEASIGPGGFGAVIKYGDKLKIVFGGSSKTTNNRMELKGAIAGLEYCEDIINDSDFSSVTVFTDSKYVKDGITSWIDRWKENGWKTSKKKDVKNEDLWKRLDEARSKIKVNWEWVKGHSGNNLNELADKIAGQSMRKTRCDEEFYGEWHDEKDIK